MEEIEGIIGRTLRRGIVGDELAEPVRREHLAWREVASGERGLAACGDADEHDERVRREGDLPGNGPTAEVVGGR
jgi:hypothetical protein